MDDKEIFNIIDNISEEKLIEIVDKVNIEQCIEENIDNKIKERIRKDIHKKIEKDSLENKNEKSKGNLNKGNRVRRKLLNGFIGTIAAMITFIVVVNTSPSIAYALEKVAGIDKLVRLVTSKQYSRDMGFRQVIDQGKYQEVNIRDKDKKAEFTVKTIAGDGLKLWIEYDFKGKGLVTGEIRVTDSNDGSVLPWMIKPYSDKKYLDIDRTSRIDEFNIEVDVYKDSEKLNYPMDIKSEEEHLEFYKKIEKYKVTTLILPIKLDKDIFGESSYKEYIVQKKIASEIGEITVEKLEISPSKTKVYLRLDNKDYSYINLKNFRIEDSENKIYFKEDNINPYGVDTSKRNIMIELDGGPSKLENLKLISGKINYVKNDAREITVDLNKKVVEENIYGVTLNNIEGNTIKLNVPESKIKLEYKRTYFFDSPISMGEYNYPNSIYTFGFNEFKSDKLIFEVLEVKGNMVDGFEIDLNN